MSSANHTLGLGSSEEEFVELILVDVAILIFVGGEEASLEGLFVPFLIGELRVDALHEGLTFNLVELAVMVDVVFSELLVDHSVELFLGVFSVCHL